MGECSTCGEQIDVVSGYSCNYCTGTYCSTHRLPEQHSCPGQSNAANLGPKVGPVGAPDPDWSDMSTAGKLFWTPIGLLLLVIGFPFRRPLAFVLLLCMAGGVFVGAAAVGVVDGGPAADAASGIDDALGGDGSGEASGSPSDDGSGDAGDLSIERAEAEVHEAINDRRREHGVEPLDYNQDLAAAARGHSEDMAARGYFSHETPEGDDIGDRYPGSCRSIGENIAQTHWDENVQTDSGVERIETEAELGEAVAEQWMNSPGHRRNLLREGWDSEGIGVALRGSEVYVTQGFCGDS